MDKKVYENTRYQNIYRHKKNKNYIRPNTKTSNKQKNPTNNPRLLCLTNLFYRGLLYQTLLRKR